MDPVVTDPSPVGTPARLTRPRDDRVIAGVCGGVGRYFGVDPVLVRVATVVFVLLAGTGLLAYLIAWIVIPEEDPSAPGQDPRPVRVGSERTSATVFGLVLIGVGGVLLLDRLFPFLSWRYLGPVLLIMIGVAILARREQR